MLNPKRQRFCEEYLKDSNGTQAAIRAGYSAKTAEVQASQLLSILNVKEHIAGLRAELSAEMEMSRELLVTKMQAIVDNTASTNADKTRAASLIADMCGYKREAAPNKEREQAIAQRMTDDEKKVATYAAQHLTAQEARAGLRLAEDSTERKTA